MLVTIIMKLLCWIAQVYITYFVDYLKKLMAAEFSKSRRYASNKNIFSNLDLGELPLFLCAYFDFTISQSIFQKMLSESWWRYL